MITPDEMMSVAAARALRDGQVCFVGIGLPSTAANLARRLHAPNLVLIYESGTLDTRPEQLPLSIGDGVLATSALTIISVPEVFNYWLQPGRIDVGFLSGAQIDRFGNINTTVIGEYDEPLVRLPGSGGAPEIAASCREVIVVMRQRARAFVEQVDFVTSVGYGTGADDREVLGLRGRGPTRVITDLGVLEPDPETKELVLTALHAGRLGRGGAGADGVGAAGLGRPQDHHTADRRRARHPAVDGDGRHMTQCVRLHYADDGPRDAPVLLFAGSLGATLAMWEPQLTLGGPVPRDPHRPPRPRRLPGAARPVRDGRARRRRPRPARRPGARAGRVLRAVARRDGRHVPRLGAPRAAHQPHAVLHLGALPRPRPVGRPDRRGRGGRHRRASPTPSSAAGSRLRGRRRTPTSSPRLRDQIANTPDAGYLGCCRAIAAWDHRDRLGAVAVPTLVIGGRRRPVHARSTRTPARSPTASPVPGSRCSPARTSPRSRAPHTPLG